MPEDPQGVRALGMTALLTSKLPVSSLSYMADVLTASPPRDEQVSGVSTLPARDRSFEAVTLEDVVVGDEEYEHQGVMLEQKTAVSIKGIAVGQIRHGELLAICKALAVPGYKNKKKATMAHLIGLKKLNEVVYDNLFSPPSKKARAPNKQAQCSFRLLNLLFSDSFAERFFPAW
ncbi:hypothetical protein JG688_00018278 [Phytophthora aleatoria]|uniref:Uncharacterized protein n=1 Tax=Phytophthora aleatoria TaxID=2496075 RepID=A0A8J5IWC7_9STRA|nr:hypothetical protein JG688_00018278 [Phytophthora aleatoria]